MEQAEPELAVTDWVMFGTGTVEVIHVPETITRLRAERARYPQRASVRIDEVRRANGTRWVRPLV